MCPVTMRPHAAVLHYLYLRVEVSFPFQSMGILIVNYMIIVYLLQVA